MELKTLNNNISIYDDLRIAEKEFSIKKNNFVIYYDYRIPEINTKFNKVYIAKEGVNNFYFNPYKAECSCEYYKKNFSIFPQRNINTICKHLYKKYKLINNGIDEITLLLIKNSLFYNEKKLIRINSKDDVIYFGLNGTNWMNVYLKQNGRYIQFAFNIEQRRWSYGLNPTNSHLIEILIDKINLL